MWCYSTSLKIMLKKIFYAIILFGYEKVNLQDKFFYLVKLVLTFAPIAFVLNYIGAWYKDNEQFFNFVLIALSINIVIGAWYHFKNKTFKWSEFWKRNSTMWLVLLPVYILLEMLRVTAGDNIIGETFKIVIELSTLLYPTSKALKNIYILSNKQFPPQFIMDRIYNFEKSGDVKDLFPDKN